MSARLTLVIPEMRPVMLVGPTRLKIVCPRQHRVATVINSATMGTVVHGRAMIAVQLVTGVNDDADAVVVDGDKRRVTINAPSAGAIVRPSRRRHDEPEGWRTYPDLGAVDGVVIELEPSKVRSVTIHQGGRVEIGDPAGDDVSADDDEAVEAAFECRCGVWTVSAVWVRQQLARGVRSVVVPDDRSTQ